ncbi:MAG: PAS domain-containing protein [Gammaproteobacteria bacterium]|nr:PAS domain-containing protein [Gammaproteobacteria bacterium]MCF6259397.1 PAS domain-containing protein [Gammaproteobacteria bacterium]
MREQDTFASRLTQLIREHNISHAEIGRVVGVSGQAVGKWAKGGNIEYDNLKTVATHFDVNWIWLRYGDDAMTSFSERRTGSKVRRGVIKSIVENEQRMRLALEVAAIGTWDFDIVDDEIVLSDVAEKLLGVGKNGFRGNKNDLLGYVAVTDRAQMDEALTEVIESRETDFDVTHRLTHGAGCVRQRGRMIEDDAGRLVRMICVITAVES